MSWLIYLLIVLSNIKIIATASALTLVVVLIVFGCLAPLIMDAIEYDEDKMLLFKRGVKLGIIVFIVSLLLSVFVPSLKESAAIYLIPKIVENEQIQGVSNKGLELLNAKLDDYIKELSEDSSGDKND